MSDAAVTIIMAGLVQIVLGVVAYLSLQAKLKYSTDKTAEVASEAKSTVRKADSAVKKADDAVEKADAATERADTAVQQSTKIAIDTSKKVGSVIEKLDHNTELTKIVAKAIDGHDEDRPGRLESMEEYAHEVKHDLKNDLNVLSIRMAEVSLKLDINTNLTREARVAAESAATKAEQAATKAEHAVVEKVGLLQDIQRHVNGGLREAMDAVLNPIRDEMVRMNNHRDQLAAEIHGIKAQMEARP